jgi:hypothetical protein
MGSSLRREKGLSFRVSAIFIALFLISWSGVRLSPLGTSTTNWPIVPTPDDRWWWMWSNRWNENWQWKPKYSEETCPSATLFTTNRTWPDLGSNPGRRGGKLATNRLSYGTAFIAPQFRTSAPALMQRPGKDLCTLWTPYAICHVTAMNNTYARYKHYIFQCRLLQQICLNYFTTPKRQLVTWTVLGLTTVKFEPLMLHMRGVSLSSYTYIWI